MSAIKDRRFVAKAGVIMLIALAMACSVFVITGEPAFAKAAKPGKIKASTVKRTDATQETMTVSFGKAKKASKYQVQYKKAGTKKWKSVKTNKRNVTLRNLDQYTKYNIRVRGIKGRKYGAWTKTKTFTTLGGEYCLTFTVGEKGELSEAEKTRYVCAGEEIGQLPIPLIVDTKETDGETFYYWTKTEGSDASIAKETMLMPDQDLTLYAFYGEANSQYGQGASVGKELSKDDAGKILLLGGEKWIILDPVKTNGTPGKGALLLLADDAKYTTYFDGLDNGWEGSKAQKWCTEFYKTTGGFTDPEKAGILGVKTKEGSEQYEVKRGNVKMKLKGRDIDGTAADKDKVFFLSAKEYIKYNKSAEKAELIPTSSDWLLRSPWAQKNSGVAYITGKSQFNLTDVKSKTGARPALNIDPDQYSPMLGSGTAEDPYRFITREELNRMLADIVMDQIKKLPAKRDITGSDNAAVVEAVSDYNALTFDQKNLISDELVNKLRDAKDTLMVYRAENEYFDGNLTLDGKSDVVLQNVTIYGNLTIHKARNVTLDNVTTQLGNVKIHGKRLNFRDNISLRNVRTEGGVLIEHAEADEIDGLEIRNGRLQLGDCRLDRLKNARIYSFRDDGGGLETWDTEIQLMENCSIHSDYIGIAGDRDNGYGYGKITEIKNCYIWGKYNALYLGRPFVVRTIRDSVLISKDHCCISAHIDNPNVLGEFRGNTILYTESRGAVLASSKIYNRTVWVDHEITDPVGTVRIYAPEGAGDVSVPSGYHLDNSDPAYNTLDNSRLENESDADFTGKQFYYVIMNDEEKDKDGTVK